MKKQIYNPFLPLDEYIPDGEPHVYGDRLYLFGSHDKENGNEFCELDYVAYSASVNDLTKWKYEGVIYTKLQDPDNQEGLPLYAPDVCKGPDGRYYLFYSVRFQNCIKVAVCNEPAGKYEYLGAVSWPGGNTLTENQPYDPAVIYADGKIFLYYGFAPTFLDLPRYAGQDLKGCSVVELEEDMLTVKQGPTIVLPSSAYAVGTSFEENPYFEAPSIRKINNLYYLVYSSVHTHQLCYAISNHPMEGFQYGGVIISNGDVGYAGRTEKDMVMSVGNNHGGLVEVEGQWYIFYHRHTHLNQYNRQACAEKIEIDEMGRIAQVTVTTSGMNNGLLEGGMSYPAVICCNLTNGKMGFLPSIGRTGNQNNIPYITNEGEEKYLANITDRVEIGYKYIKLKDIQNVGISYRGNGSGNLEIFTERHKICGSIEIKPSDKWNTVSGKVTFEQHDKELYFIYRGKEMIEIKDLYL